MKKNIVYALFSLLACLSSYYSANGHAGVGVVVKDGCDRYLAIGTWHSSVLELNNTINSSKGVYIDVNGDGNFANCCSGTSSSEFFTFTDFTMPNTPVTWDLITPGSSTLTELVSYFNNSTIYNSSNLANRFTAEKVWDPGCSFRKLQSWVILKLPASLNPGTIYNCRTSTTSVVEMPCNSQTGFQITFGSDINITGNGTVLCESDSLNLTSSAASDLEWFRNGALIQGPSNDSTITVLQSGNYTVRKGGTGCQSRTSEIYAVVMSPKVNLGVDTLICIGDSVLLDGGVGVSYLWSTSQISRFIYNFGDSVSVTRTDSDGCIDSDSIIVSFHAQPKAQFTIDDSLECFRDHEIVAVNKSTLAQGAVQSRTWTTESTDYLNIDTLHQVYSSADDYTIQLTIESDQGCFDSLTKAVTIYPMPVAQFTPDTTHLCERGNEFAIDYQGSISAGSINKLWSFGDGVSSMTADDTTKIYSTFGSYPVRLELVSGFDCRDTTEQTLTVHAQPKAQFTIDDSLECFRDHEIVAINKSTLAQGAVQSRTWTTESTDYLNIDTLNQVYSSADDYTIQLTIESDQGCFDSLTKAVTIYPMPVAQFTPDEVCLGELVSFENLSKFEFGTVSSRWSFGDGNTSSEESPIHQYSSADSFDVTLVVSTEQDCSDTIEYKKIAVVHPVPYAVFVYKKTKSWKKETQYLFSDSSIDADFLRWEIDGFSESNEDDFQFTFQDSGTREVKLIATNEFSCSDTTSKTISVFPDLVYYIPSGFTPNGDGLNDEFNVIGPGYVDMYNLKLINRWGEVLFESNEILEGWDGRFMGEIVQNGVYIYLVTFRDIGSKKRIFENGKVTLIR